MATIYSNPSQVSQKSQILLEEVTRKSSTKLARMTGIFDDEDIRTSWNAFGLYISRQLRSGRAITIPQFGVFTFTAPEVVLDGVSNPWERDKQFRNPVFIIDKNFAHGHPIKSGIYQSNNIRPYKVHGLNGKIAQTKINFTEVGIYCNKTRDQAQQTVQRVIRQLSDDCKKKGSVDMELPNVGVFRIRNMVAAVQFNQFLSRDAKQNTHNFKSVQEKKSKVSSNLTAQTIQRFENYKNMSDNMRDFDQNYLEIDQDAKKYLSQELAIDVNSLCGSQSNKKKLYIPSRPMSSQNRYSNGNMWQTQSVRNSQSNYMNRPMTASHLSQSNLKQINLLRNQKAEKDIAFRKLKYWIKKSCLNAEDSFIEICNAAFKSKLKNKNAKLTTDNLFNAIKSLGIDIDPVSLQELHRILDYNKDGFIDLNDWVHVIQEANNAYLQKIKDVISENSIKTEDVLLTMKLQQNQKAISLIELKDAIKRLDPTLNDSKAVSACKSILKNREVIDVQDVIEELGCEDDVNVDEAATYIDPNWFNMTLKRLYNKLQSSNNPDQFKQQLEKMDLSNSGRINYVQFKTCLMNCNLGFTLSEVKRFVRYLSIDEDDKLDYYEFLKELNQFGYQQSEIGYQKQQKKEDQKGEEEEDEEDQPNYFKGFQDFVTKLKGFMQKNQIDSPQQFLERIYEFLNSRELKLSTFATFLFKKGFTRSNEEEITYYAKKIDIDGDGIISQEDITTFFQRLDYLDDKNMFIQTQTANNFMTSTRNVPENPLQKPQLYPVVQLEPQQINVLKRELKQKLYLKKLSFYDFFKRIDQNQDGFITIDEWSQNIDSISKYSKQVKDGLFAYLDIKKIGMIDYQTFLASLQKEEQETDDLNKKKDQDDWEWTQFILMQMKEWFARENLQVEDAFRVIDSDFDGFIGKKDIEKFLKEILHISPKDITSDRINRVFKLMDEFKRGQIELTDLKRLLTDKQDVNDNFTISGGKFIKGVSSFDWRLNAKQQIGLVLSRQFSSLTESFNQISGQRDRIVYKSFEDWIKNSRALIGFDLSDYQIQMVYSDIDPHKKGYLSERDWVQAFSGFNWKNQMLMEIQETVMTHFDKEEDAFMFFSQGNSQRINQKNFNNAIRALFNQRFSSSDISTLWKQLSLATGNQYIQRVDFINIYDGQKTHKSLKHADNNTSNRPRSSMLERKPAEQQTFQDALHKTTAESFMDQKCEQIVKKVKSILRASNKSIKQIFEEFDNDGSGELSNIEFKNAFRSIGIGLTSKEIDYLLNYCDESGDGFINWQEFISKFKLGDAQNRILDRSKTRLQHINDNIHYYMLSPKDAFRLFNQDRTGMMTYNDFTTFMSKLCLMANEKLPSFAILKDIYQTIDIRKDGLIDMTEWIQTFKQFQPPNASMQGRPMMHQRPQTAQVQTKKQQSQVNPNAYHIEASQDYDKVMQVIGRNRKFLLQTFNDINKTKAVTFQMAKEVLQKVLMSVGVVLEEDHYPLLIKFAERDGIVDYRFMLEVYKERIQRISVQPDPHLM